MILFSVIIAWIVFLFLLLFLGRIRKAKKYRDVEKKTHPLRKETFASIGKVDKHIVAQTCSAGNRGVFFHGVGTGKPKRKTNKVRLSKITKLKHKKQ